MESPETCWTDIRAAAEGDESSRERFARVYEPVLRAYLGARWRRSPLQAAVDDALQEVFVECLKEDGLLERADPSRGSGFRAFLFGAALRVARRTEAGRGQGRELRLPSLYDVEDGEQALTRVFDRAWATALLRHAGRRQEEAAAALEGEARERALRRVELLHERFRGGLPIRDIARKWEVDAAHLHEEYRRARQEYRRALLEVVRFHCPGPEGEVERRAAELASMLD